MKTKTPMRVLLVDDDVLISNDVTDLLEEAGHTVVGAARDGRQAIEMVKSLKPDLVFMDIEMPDMNGLQAACHIREQCPVPIILLTAHDDPELVERGGRVGATAYLVKPPDLGEMTRTMTMARARFDDLKLLELANSELKSCLRDIKVLRGLLPICNHCQRIRDDNGYWQRVKEYFKAHSNFQFIETLCEPCMARLVSGQSETPPQPPGT